MTNLTSRKFWKIQKNARRLKWRVQEGAISFALIKKYFPRTALHLFVLHKAEFNSRQNVPLSQVK
jgi:hypothetical protein